jgi:hypothetical protein
MKTFILMLGLCVALSSCHREVQESFTKASSYPPSCQSDPRFNLFLNSYNLCSKSDPEKVDLCIRNDLANLVEGINAQCKSEPATRSLFGKALLKLVRIAWSGVKDDSSQESALKLTSYWLTKFRTYYSDPGQAVRDDIVPVERAIHDALRDENARLSKIELDVFSKESQSYTDSGAVADNDLYLDQRLGFLDRTAKVISSASPGLPADTATLLTANALNLVLESLMPRLTFAANIHDLACAAIQCRPSDLMDYDYMRTYKFLSLLSRGNYGDARAVGDMGVGNKLRNALYANEGLLHSTLDGIKSMEEGRLGGARPSDLARDLTETLSMADELYTRQQRLGFFFTNDSKTLLFSFSPSAKASAQALLASIKLSLDSVRADLKVNRELIYNSLRDGLGKDLQLTEVQSSKAVSEAMLAELNEDLVGLRKAVVEQDKNLAGFTAELEGLAKQNSGFIGSRMKFVPIDSFAVSAADAKYTANMLAVGDETDIPTLAVTKIDLSKGQILNLDISNEWGPVCALKKTEGGQQLDVSTLRAGPDGFIRVQDQGKSTIDSVERSNSTSVSSGTTRSKSYCDSIAVSESLTVPVIGTGFSASTSKTSCTAFDKSFRHTMTDTVSHSASSSFRDSASFQSGIRLADTPFTSMPAASLLAVIMPQGATAAKDRIRVQVLDRKTSLIASQDETIYIVVNDCKDASSTPALGSLTIQGGTLRPSGGELLALMPKVAEEVNRFTTESERLLSEGKEISNQLETLKSEAYARNAGLLSEPESAAIFNYAISYAATRIDRLAKIKDKTREIIRLQTDLLKLSKSEDLLRSEKALVQSRLKSLVNEFAFFSVGERAASASGDMQKYIIPFLAFLEVPRNTLLAAANSLALSASLSKHPSSALGEISSLANEINNLMIKDGGLISSATSESFVAVRIPNPELDSRARFEIPTLDRARSEAFWRGVFQSTDRPTTLNLGPEDLYNAGRDLSLSCSDGKPVITNMAVILLTEEGTLNEATMDELNSFKNLTVTMGMDMFYPSPSQDLRFRLNKATDGNVKSKLGYASPKRFGRALTALFDSRKLANSGDGLSPFTGLTLGLKDSAYLREEVQSQSFFQQPESCDATAPKDALDEDSPGPRPDTSKACVKKSYPKNLTDIVVVFSLRYNAQYAASDFGWIRTCAL